MPDFKPAIKHMCVQGSDYDWFIFPVKHESEALEYIEAIEEHRQKYGQSSLMDEKKPKKPDWLIEAETGAWLAEFNI